MPPVLRRAYRPACASRGRNPCRPKQSRNRRRSHRPTQITSDVIHTAAAAISPARPSTFPAARDESRPGTMHGAYFVAIPCRSCQVNRTQDRLNGLSGHGVCYCYDQGSGIVLGGLREVNRRGRCGVRAPWRSRSCTEPLDRRPTRTRDCHAHLIRADLGRRPARRRAGHQPCPAAYRTLGVPACRLIHGRSDLTPHRLGGLPHLMHPAHAPQAVLEHARGTRPDARLTFTGHLPPAPTHRSESK